MENGSLPPQTQEFVSRMALNDNKAGMEGLDRDKINKIIMETSKVSSAVPSAIELNVSVAQRRQMDDSDAHRDPSSMRMS